MADKLNLDYGLSETERSAIVSAPEYSYLPKDPLSYRPGICLIGCGGISVQHLGAYKAAGYRVVALCDIKPENAVRLRDEFYPDAKVFGDYREALAREDFEVVDIATHPAARLPIMHEAIKRRKHILSQKPFVTDIDQGNRLLDEAETAGVKVAVNQNGRWAPHFSYIHQAIVDGAIGEAYAVHASVAWDHNWIAGTSFENIHNLILYDFAIHWFDIVTWFMGEKAPRKVFATVAHSPGQSVKPPFLSQAMIHYDEGQASLSFEADVHRGCQDRTVVLGTAGTIRSEGPGLNEQSVTMINKMGESRPRLKGSWFPDGFHGTMGELLCAIEENREPSNGARGNLKSLELCFAALHSADTGNPAVPGAIRRLVED